jgi:hypothetical protein
MQIAACFWSKLHQIIGCFRNLDTGSYLFVLVQLHTKFVPLLSGNLNGWGVASRSSICVEKINFGIIF